MDVAFITQNFNLQLCDNLHMHPFLNLQTNVVGKPQHLSLELVDGELKMSLELGSRSSVGTLRVARSVTGVVSHIVTVTIQENVAILTLDPGSCDVQELCQLTLNHTNGVQSVSLNERLYVGGIPTFTPYIRSKLDSLDGFTGCLSVSPLADSCHSTIHLWWTFLFSVSFVL